MKTYHILVVDDDVFSLNLILSILKNLEHPFQISEAKDGNEAVEIATSLLPDLIIMDWDMPNLSGIDALKAIRKKELTSKIPVIMATAMLSSENLELAFKSGANDYLRKPVDRVELLARMNSALELSESYKEIMRQKAEIQEKNRKIINSIDYASRIQTAMLPSMTNIKESLPESFIYYRPKDIVSGDFYWFHKYGDKIFLAAIDCTGHGVPGALMSMMGNAYLNLIVNQPSMTPELVLNQLNVFIRQGLQQSQNDNFDGMSISLCLIDKQAKTIDFAGAESSIVYFQNDLMTVVDGDLYSIGGFQREANINYTKHTISIEQPTTIYLFSDGYYDQFGGQKGDKYMRDYFLFLLNQIHNQPVDHQLAMLDQTLTEWMGEKNTQTDDIMIIGVKL